MENYKEFDKIINNIENDIAIYLTDYASFIRYYEVYKKIKESSIDSKDILLERLGRILLDLNIVDREDALYIFKVDDIRLKLKEIKDDLGVSFLYTKYGAIY